MNEPSAPDDDLHGVARVRLVRVLGERRGDLLMAEVLAEIGIERIADADQLYAFAKALVARGSFAGAVGGLLTVHALVRGARGEPPSPR